MIIDVPAPPAFLEEVADLAVNEWVPQEGISAEDLSNAGLQLDEMRISYNLLTLEY